VINKPSLRQIGEVAAVLGVVSSLIFVGLELRNNARAARASAYQQLGVAVTNSWMTKAANRELNDLIYTAESDDDTGWESLNESDRRLVESFVVANLRLYETVFHQVEEHLLAKEAMESLGWNGFGNTNLVRRTWARIRDRVTPSFADYLESTTPHLRNR
jgi:hypothetical protein